jgi:hypothetical protein
LSGWLEWEFTVALEWDEVYIFNKGNKIKIWDLNRDNLNKIDFENLDYATLWEVYISFIIILIIVLWFWRFGHDFIKKTIGEKKKEEITTIGKKRERIISFFRYYFKEDDVKSNEILANMNMMSFRFTKKEGIETLKYQEAFGYNSYSPLYIYFVNCLINWETFDDFFERLSRIEERRVLLDEIKPFLDWKEFNPSFELKFEWRKVTENIPKDWED